MFDHLFHQTCVNMWIHITDLQSLYFFTCAAHSDPDTIKKLLATQVTSPVLWENTMETILGMDFERAVELGPGKVTAGILKRFSKSAECTNVEV